MTSDGGEPAQRRYVVRDAAEPAAAPAPEPRRYVPAGTPVGGAPRRVSGRTVALGVGAAVVVGSLLALLLRPNLDEGADEPDRAPAAAAQEEEERGSAPEFRISAAREAYRPPDRDAVAEAYAAAGRVYAAEGVSGLARNGLECFRQLEQSSTYRQLDYCLAFDAFAAAVNQRVQGGQPAPPDSYFGQAAERHLAVAEAVIGEEGDASARLSDLRRMAIEVARLSGPAVQTAAAPAAASADPGPAAAEPPAAPSQPQLAQAPARQPATSAPAPSRPQAAPAQRQAQAKTQTKTTTQAPARPAPAEAPAPRRPAQADARVAPSPGPTAREVAAARPARSAGPSFNCRYARTTSERMVCARPELAAADRRLNEAYEDAIAAGADRAALRLEQDRWLALREGAAPDPNAVRDVYERRIRELQERR